MKTNRTDSPSDRVRQHASEIYLETARRGGKQTFSVNVGVIHKALALNNRVPLVCAALTSRKFLTENRLRLVSKTGPPSGQSTTVTYTYEMVTGEKKDKNVDPLEAWKQLRGALKDVFAELGGGENFIRSERANFYGPGKDR